MKLADLRKLAKKGGVENWDTLDSRDELIKAIKALEEPKEPEASTPEEVKPNAGKAPVVPLEEEEEEEEEGLPAGLTEKRVKMGGKAAKMKARLALQPKRSILIPREGKEKAGTTFPVCINDYRLNIMKGVYVEVPKQVADVIMDHFNQTDAADALLVRKEDGKPMKLDGTPSPLG